MTSIFSFCGSLGRRAKQHLKQWTKPVTATLVTGALSGITRSRADLIAENMMLRQQLIVLKRQVKRCQLTNGDLSWPNTLTRSRKATHPVVV